MGTRERIHHPFRISPANLTESEKALSTEAYDQVGDNKRSFNQPPGYDQSIIPPLSSVYSRRSVLQQGLALACGASIVLAACDKIPVLSAKHAYNTTEDQLSTATTEFGFQLTRTLAQMNNSKNVFISSLSMFVTLAMVYNGARGVTQRTMANAMHIEQFDTDTVNRGIATLLTHMKTVDAQVLLSSANAVWLKQSYMLLPAFQQAMKHFYAADVTSLNFADPDAPDTINAWVRQQTRGLIPAIVRTIPPQAILYLTNAVYLKAPWTLPFTAALTHPGPFTTSSGQQKTLPFMRNTDFYAYVKTSAYEAIALPYAARKLAMYILLPSAGTGVQTPALHGSMWKSVIASLRMQRGSITLPKFSLDYTTSMQRALTSLGMGLIFTQGADFSGMVERPAQRVISQEGDLSETLKQRIAVSEILHRAILKVDEQGTLAAAATSVRIGITRTLPTQEEAFAMIVNRPFFCAIGDTTTGTLLFMGIVGDPA